jgi:7-keto-8-aminopelargonate synthetase-like enzyme
VALEGMLAKLPGPKLIAVDGVYSMKGTFAPVAALADLCARYDAVLFLDDVHGFGALGDGGCGLIESVPRALRQRVILLASFAKSASNPVAFVAYPDAYCTRPVVLDPRALPGDLGVRGRPDHGARSTSSCGSKGRN